MIRKISVPGVIIPFLVAAALICSGPVVTGGEEGKLDPASNTVVSHLLDGKTFSGPTGEKGKKVHHEDVLSFSNGLFTSSECFQFGFKGGPYSTTVEGDAIHFKAVTVSPTHGKMEWTGRLKGDVLEVTYNWTKERWLWTTYREYWFKGTLQR